MAYWRVGELPTVIRQILPPDARRLFCMAFDAAYRQTSDIKRSWEVAWAAVEAKFAPGPGRQWVLANASMSHEAAVQQALESLSARSSRKRRKKG